MNRDTEILLRNVAGRVERAVTERDCPAMVAVQGDRTLVLSDYDYLRDAPTAAAFEQRAAEKAQQIHAVRFVFAVPQVWLFDQDTVYGRAVANLPLREGEQELIAWMSFDADDGVDYGFLPYARRPSGEPVFDDHTVITVPVQPYDDFPGRHLLRALTHESGDPTST
ncbi:hypothetical protein [Streptomyces rapamycinicus]|uniref:Uncharacterized protein n=2 Tax=Streptomyces rapamycinicus TaxID=1226757 RepID=A0A0A0NU82_STRRN|nr:hypothetical protein [Streptomyces rapamycinicus]AGP58350.1 hypothetical protein M271_34695 [Streptomyces rapamycinicus NRRL 5491]MBB4786044.1 hypothetical protein [Streptomyces rapamycinicus]RLV78493.1 hypothetical protein D3C57_108950 [Streptomyces rapamycinicus NRRL 5491]UTO66166.1 hypothetical protein LJB45_30155 [Streptomyces rapamycinicus]UTP34120.1 hypothetical protein LIV37_35290 [Streptomyces rapamycinicus NRRL 5491]